MLIIRHKIKLALFYISKYWWIGALVALSFVMAKFFLTDRDIFKGLYEEKAKQADKELKVLKESQEQERKEKKKADAEYKALVEALEQKRKLEGKKIKREEKKEIKKIVAMPLNQRVKAIAELYDLEIIQ